VGANALRRADQVSQAGDQRVRIRAGCAANNVPRRIFGYMASGIDDEVTLRAKPGRLPELQLRIPFGLVDVTQGRYEKRQHLVTNYDSADRGSRPWGSEVFHEEGEDRVAKKAAQRAGTISRILIGPVRNFRGRRRSPQGRGGRSALVPAYEQDKWDVAKGPSLRAREKAGCAGRLR